MSLGSGSGYETNEESWVNPDDQLWAWLDGTAAEAAKVRQDEAKFTQLDRWLQLYYGEHYTSRMPTYRPPVVVNELRTLILSEASDLGDVQFRTYILKDLRHGNRDTQAERALRALWTRQQIDIKITEAVTWAAIMGTGFLRVWWDPDAAHGMGDVVVDVLDPRQVLPDPDAPDDTKLLFVIYESVLDTYEIRRLFPRKGKYVNPEDSYSEKAMNYKSGTANIPPGMPLFGPMSNTQTGFLGPGEEGYKKARARVLDMYIKDDTLTEVAEQLKNPDGSGVTDEEGNPVLKTRKEAKYPRGRRIVGSNGVILYDGPNNAPDFGLVRIALEPTLGKFWGGVGFVQQTAELQLAADKLASSVVENAIRLNNGIMVFTGNHGLDTDTFVGMPAQIVSLSAGGSFDIKYPPPMPDDMINAPERLLNLQRRILGFPDARSGSGGKGNVSPELTETEISQSQGTTRLRAKHLYFAVQRLSEMIVARMMENYTIPRVIPATEGESFQPVIWEPVQMDPNKHPGYAVHIDPASFQVVSKSMQRRLSLALYRMGAIDRRAALETLGWAHWEDVAERMDNAEKMAAMAKLQSKKSK